MPLDNFYYGPGRSFHVRVWLRHTKPRQTGLHRCPEGKSVSPALSSASKPRLSSASPARACDVLSFIVARLSNQELEGFEVYRRRVEEFWEEQFVKLGLDRTDIDQEIEIMWEEYGEVFSERFSELAIPPELRAATTTPRICVDW